MTNGRWRLPTSCLVIAASLARPAAAQRETTRESFERAAGKIAQIEYGDVVYGRVGWRHVDASEQALLELLARRDSVDDLAALLRHESPRVRGLAIVALYDREDPKVLPLLATLARDEAQAIPQRTLSSAPFIAGAGKAEEPPPTPCAVRRVVDLTLGHYLRTSGFIYGVDGNGAEPGFEEYWRDRSERASCASWLRVKLDRASGAVTPFQASRLERVRGVRAEVDRLAPADRAITLLWLPSLENQFATDAERLEAARFLGREKLLALLAREPPTGDPDFRQHSGSNKGRYPCEDIARFVLEHARELLKPDDAPALLDLERAETERVKAGDAYPMRTPWWAIGAASLDAEGAQRILDAAFDRFAQPHDAFDRGELLAANWRLAGARAERALVARFYLETLARDGDEPGRLTFLRALAADGSPPARAMLRAIVRDPSFMEMDWTTLEQIARTVNRWTPKPVISEDELRSASHPLGRRERSTKAMETYPKETRALLAQLRDWCERIRSSAPSWAQEAK